MRAWLAGLPAAIVSCVTRWSLCLGDPFEPGGSCSWVAPSFTAAGARVLKVTYRHEEAEGEAEALRAWAGHGAVLLHDSDPSVDDHTAALLLEWCPGPTLSAALPEREQDRVIASVLERLWAAAPDGSAFRPLAAMCENWACSFEQRLASAPSGLDAGLASAGMSLLRQLSQPGPNDVLLATDLHAGNVLAGLRAPWLAIDPKPYRGDAAYDVVQHMLNCEERLATDPVGLAERMAALLDLDAERVVHWLFARCVQESIEDPALAHVARLLG